MDTQAQAPGLPGARAASNSDERLWAALAHASVLLLFVGPFLPLILWSTQRKKSKYASFHALQAMAYQALFFWVWLAVIWLVVIFVMLGMFALVAANPQAANQPFAVLALQLVIFGVVLGSMLLFMAVGVVGAVLCLMGREFRYPLFGGALARYLGYQGADGAEMDETRQDYVVASVSHSTCVVQLWGLATPLVTWLTQHDLSPFLRFQAMQAAIYQGLGTLAYFAWLAVYMGMMFGMMGAALALGNLSKSAVTAVFGVGMMVMLCVMGVLLLGVPLYHLFGFLAALATLRGRDYRYPVLGSLLRRRMKVEEAS